jgi:hypothetical protein
MADVDGPMGHAMLAMWDTQSLPNCTIGTTHAAPGDKSAVR